MDSLGGWLARLVGGVLAGMLLLCASPGLAASPLQPVKVGVLPFYSSALSYLALDRGFFKNEGLEVTFFPFAGGSLVNEAVLGGGVDFGMGVGLGPATALTSRKAKVLVVAAEAYTDGTPPPDLIVVRKDSPITDVRQLDGKRVAVPAKGTGVHVFLEAIKQRLGIKFTLLEVPSESQWPALSRGDVDAVMNETPFPEQMQARGGRYIYGMPNKDVVPYFQMTLTVTTRDFAEKNPETVKRMAKVIIRTSRWAMENPEKTRAIITERLKYTPEVVKLIHPQSYKFMRNGEHMMPSIRWWGQQMKALNIIQVLPSYEEYYVTRYVEAALRDLGRIADPDFEKAVTLPIPQ